MAHAKRLHQAAHFKFIHHENARGAGPALAGLPAVAVPVPLCTCGPRPARGRYVISAFSGSGAAASPSICSMNEAVIAFAFLGVGPNANT